MPVRMTTPAQRELDLSQSTTSDRLSNGVLQWLARSYQTLQQWRSTATATFIAANGQSDLARNRMAFLVRAHFLEAPPQAESVERWQQGFEEIETVELTPPKVTASNAAYVDWLRIADYLLLACASPIEELEKANQQRESEFQIVLNSYRIRSIVYDAVVIIREDASLSDDALLKTTQQSHPDASMANVKEARRVSKEDTAVTSPKEPRAAAPMEPYQAIYF
ncbi:MAG: hypothetical protein CMJ59_15450 [Planctomycetaceae bacterium]|nr:hypothetical protein [Planctomycetaceae bacterium]